MDVRAWSEAAPIGRKAARKLATEIWTLAMTVNFRPLSGDGRSLKRRGLTENSSRWCGKSLHSDGLAGGDEVLRNSTRKLLPFYFFLLRLISIRWNSGDSAEARRLGTVQKSN